MFLTPAQKAMKKRRRGVKTAKQARADAAAANNPSPFKQRKQAARKKG